MNLAFKTAGVAMGLALALSASAAPISPTFGTFGPLAGATFSGTGIPNNPVAITTVGGLTIGLAASQRVSGPNLGHNGAGTYSAPAGVSPFNPSPADPYAMWNFNMYVSGATASMAFRLFYDFNPAEGNDINTHGTITVPGAAITGGQGENSWNLGMDFLATTNPAFGIVAPTGTFDPNARGQYTFALVAYELNGAALGNEIGRSAIAVNVPEPGTFALAGLALLGLAAARRRA
jgi:hypothetical protein